MARPAQILHLLETMIQSSSPSLREQPVHKPINACARDASNCPDARQIPRLRLVREDLVHDLDIGIVSGVDELAVGEAMSLAIIRNVHDEGLGVGDVGAVGRVILRGPVRVGWSEVKVRASSSTVRARAHLGGRSVGPRLVKEEGKNEGECDRRKVHDDQMKIKRL
ncbi:hypothetical protein B0H13DRAFT_1960766 [Mycena leptocephala]|nr:hypothetical protein B0H13DRAFT_1960766 [Mycena leptocephala]